MAKVIDIQVLESEKELISLRNSSSNFVKRDRIKFLLLLKKGKCKYTKDLASKTGLSRKTIYNWLKNYREGGLEKLCKNNKGGNNTPLLNQATIKEIEILLNDPYNTIISYVELLSILQERHQPELTYGALYKHCRIKHGSKLKVARKSHHKKDPQAVEAFKKNTQYTVRD